MIKTDEMIDETHNYNGFIGSGVTGALNSCNSNYFIIEHTSSTSKHRAGEISYAFTIFITAVTLLCLV
jgi:hypothetical protein